MDIIWTPGGTEEDADWTTTVPLVGEGTDEHLVLSVTRHDSKVPAYYVWVIDYFGDNMVEPVEGILSGSAGTLEEAQARAMGAALTHPDRKPVRYAWGEGVATVRVRVDLWTGEVDHINVNVSQGSVQRAGLGETGEGSPATNAHHEALARAMTIAKAAGWRPLDASPDSITWEP